MNKMGRLNEHKADVFLFHCVWLLLLHHRSNQPINIRVNLINHWKCTDLRCEGTSLAGYVGGNHTGTFVRVFVHFQRI